jgi:hypothetical protein
MELSHNEAILRPDFARRVVQRVRKAKRRRRFYRWALTSTVACALAVVAILSLSTRYSRLQPSALIASRNDTPPEQVAAPFEFGSSLEPDSLSFHQPLVFFFPSAIAVSDFQSSEASYWHSYDPWWNPKP